MDGLVHGVSIDPDTGITMVADWDAICKVRSYLLNYHHIFHSAHFVTITKIYKIPKPSLSKADQSNTIEGATLRYRHQIVKLVVSIVSAKFVLT